MLEFTPNVNFYLANSYAAVGVFILFLIQICHQFFQTLNIPDAYLDDRFDPDVSSVILLIILSIIQESRLKICDPPRQK